MDAQTCKSHSGGAGIDPPPPPTAAISVADTADASSLEAAEKEEVEEEDDEMAEAEAAAAADDGLSAAIVAAAATANMPLGESIRCVGPASPADEAELPASECACLCGKSAVRGLKDQYQRRELYESKTSIEFAVSQCT
jgi:gamma-glutamyl:cysteine ligase YbdK (ATP-grasp superfamily)